MALNGVMAVVLRCVTEFGIFEANYVTVIKVRVRLILSAQKNVARRI